MGKDHALFRAIAKARFLGPGLEYFGGMEHSRQDAAREGSQDAAPDGVIGSVANALRLLQLLAGSGEIRVNRAGRELGISRSTVHRLLSTLTAYGYVEQDPASRSYRPGPALTGIGIAAVQGSNLRTVARPALARLASLTNETSHLMVLRGDHVLCLDSIESTRSVRTGSRVGWSLPSHTTAGGKVLLAGLTEPEVVEIFPSETIAGTGRRRPVRRIDLLAELELVRARGYATNLGITEPDVAAVGVTLLDRHGRARAALAVTAPSARGDEAWAREVGRAALEIAAEFRESIV